MSKPTSSEVLSLSLPDRIRLAQALWDSISEVPENVVFLPYHETAPFHGSRSRRLRRHGHYSESQSGK